jgi:predicted GNAT family acetyltransferase
MPYITSRNKIEYEEDGTVLACVDFPDAGGNAVEICHTFVDPSLRGRGIAAELMVRAADTIRATGRKAVATCSYAVKWFGEHPENEDILG